MSELKRRAIGYATVLTIALVLTALGYQWGMATFEDRPRTFLSSLQFTVEMFTTTGFGGDSPWETPQMHAYIIIADLLGMALLVGALPVIASPLVKAVLSTSAPEQVSDNLTDHVVICSDTARAQVLIDELDAHAVPYVIAEPNRERADELQEAGYQVIRADPSTTDGLRAARFDAARALVSDVSDQLDASIVLTAKEFNEDVSIVSVVEEASKARYHRLAGADHVLSPRSLLGESLAAKVTTALRTGIDDTVTIGDQLQLAEVSIRHGSEIAGRTLAESGIREKTGASVIGAWVDGVFNPATEPNTRFPAGTVLLVSGMNDQLEELVAMTQSEVRGFRPEEAVIFGYGQVGQTVAARLEDAAIPYTVVDQADAEGVDVVGDATERVTLTEAGVTDADTVVLALPDDTATEFATLMVRDQAPETEILARVQKEANASKTYRAGADYVLSLTTVTGRMIASQLFEGRDVLSLDQQIAVIRERTPQLVGQTLADADVRDRTGCTVVGIERDGTVITDVGPQTTVQQDDELIVVGTDDGIRVFEREFC